MTNRRHQASIFSFTPTADMGNRSWTLFTELGLFAAGLAPALKTKPMCHLPFASTLRHTSRTRKLRSEGRRDSARRPTARSVPHVQGKQVPACLRSLRTTRLPTEPGPPGFL